MELARDQKREAGFSMIEILVSIVLLSIMGLTVATSTISSMQLQKRSYRSSLAAQLALTRLEDFAAIDPATLDDSFDETVSGIVIDNITYTRTVDVTENVDGSRTVTVTASNDEASLGGAATYSSTFFLWSDS